MTLDFHYQSANIVKYRTDVTFGWLDLMVSFGGIAGLFLGCSILSGVEIVYYILIISFIMLKKLKKRTDIFLHRHSNQIRVAEMQRSREKSFRRKAENIKVIKIQSLSEIDANEKAKLSNSNRTRY